MAVEFDIGTLVSLTEKGKYATSVAGFEVIDMDEHLELPKKIRRRKPAVRSLHVLSNNIVKWDYIKETDRETLREKLGLNSNKSANNALDSSVPTPVTKEKSEPAKTPSKAEKTLSVKDAEK